MKRLIGTFILALAISAPVMAQQAVAPGDMAPVAQRLTDDGINFMYVANDNGSVFITIFTKDRNWKAAPTCELLTDIGHVTKVTIRYEVKEPTTTEMVTERHDYSVIFHDGSVDSAVCTDKRNQ